MKNYLGTPEYQIEIYQLNDKNWFIRFSGSILPKYLVKESTMDQSKIKALEVLTNKKEYITGLRDTSITNLKTGDTEKLLLKKSIILFYFSDNKELLLAYVFKGFYKNYPNQITSFAESFYLNNKEKIKERIDTYSLLIGSPNHLGND